MATYNQAYGAGESVLCENGIQGWHLVSTNPVDSLANDHVNRDSDGHFLDGSRHVGGKRAQITEVWQPDGDSSTLTGFQIGDVDNLVCIESASLACVNNDRPRLTLTGHIHKQTESVTGGSAKHIGDKYTCTFVLPTNCYGAVNPFPNAGISTVNDYEITSSTQTFTIAHVDEPGITGEFLVGVSRGVTRTGEMALTTANEVEIGAGDNGWKIMSAARPTANEGVVKLTVNGTQYISTANQTGSAHISPRNLGSAGDDEESDSSSGS